jgi:putative iron-only hydrogenase system regulator
MEETRIAIVAVIVEDFGSAMEVNETLHQFGSLIVGRMGLPYRDRGLHVIALILDGEPDRISALTGKLGKIPHVTVKAAMTKK